MDSISLSQGFCINNFFSIDATVYYSDPPATGTMTITIDDGATTYDTTYTAPFSSPSQWVTNIPTGGGAYTVTATFSDDAGCTIGIGGTAPIDCDCSANIGTFTNDVDGSAATNDIQLCFGETFTTTPNGDMVPPADVNDGTIPYNPGIGYLVYECLPSVFPQNNLWDPGTGAPVDPCLLGLASFGGDFSDINFLGGPSYAGNFTDNIIYYVPITFYDTINGYYSVTATTSNCYSMGTPIAVQYLPEVLSSNPTENCQDSSFTITITGGAPEIDGSNYVVSNLSPANAYFIDSIATHNGTLQIGGLLNGDMYSFDVADTNGCPITVTGGPFVGLPNANAGINDTSCTLTYTMSAIPSIGTGTWTGQAGVTVAPANSATGTATATAPGTYELYWTENNTGGCTDVDTVSITFTNLSYTAVVVDATCGNADGVITITPADGLAPYTYSNDNGVTFQALDSFVNLVAGPYNIVVEDVYGCQVTGVENVNNAGAPVINGFTLTDPLCNGATNGQIIVHATGGSTPYQYNIDAGAQQADSTFNGLAGNTSYVFTVEDALGCQVSLDTILVDPVLLVLDSAIGTDVVCNGDDDGTINLYAQGGTGTLEYSIDNEVTYVATSNFTNLAPATYMVWVKDANGCTDSTQVVIDEPAPISIPNVVDSVVCFGTTTGQVVVTPLGGTTPYSYSWTSSATTDSIETGLAAGNVTVTVTDANACFQDSTFTVFEPAQFTYTTDSLNANCNQPDGWAAVVGFAGGTGNYTYQWDAAAANQITDTAFNLIPGNYSVTISDVNLCDTTITITVGNNPSVILDSLSLTQPLCNGDANGEVVVHAIGGATPYQFSVNSGALQADSLFTGLTGATSYLFTVEDAAGCPDTMSIVLINPTQLVLDSAIGTDVVCNGNDDGTINLYAQGGTGTLEYSIDNDTTYVATSSFTNLAPATYMVWVRDENGCTDSTQVIIDEPAPISIPNLVDSVVCFGTATGQIQILPQGGVSPYTYGWGPAVSSGTIASDLIAGTYTVTVVDANLCWADSTFVVYEPTQFSYTTDSLNANCNLPDGWAAVVGFAGGTGNYTYQWDAATGNQTNDTAFNLVPGTYNVTITDANLCDTTISITVGNNPSFTTSITDVINVKCKDGADGSATANGSDPLVNYTYSWSTVPVQNTQIATGLQAGVWYYVTVTDPTTTCFEMDSVLLTEPDSVTIVATGTQTICAAQSADLSVTAQGGSGGYTYTWDNGLGNGQNQTVTPAPNSVTTYSVYATDDSLCTSAPATVTVTVLQELTVVASSTDTICPYESTVLSADPYFGNLGPYSYSWSPSAGLNNDTLRYPTAQPTQPTMYYVTLSDGCSPDAIDSVYIGVWPLPNPLATVDTLSLCEEPMLPFTFDNTTSLANGMLDTTNVTWHFGDGSSVLGDTITWDSIQHTYTAPGTYTVSMTAYTTPAQGGCYVTDSVQTVVVNPLPTPDFISNPNPTTMFEPEVDFLDNTIDGNIWGYSWDFAGLGGSPFPNPSFEFPNDTVGEYPVTLTVTDANGCVNSITKIVIVNGEFGLYVPNTFTPDFDNKNDIFLAKGFGIANEDFIMQIYDRWGEKIFEANDIDQGWDGFYKGTRVKTDTYVWKIIFKDVNGEKHTKHGHVNIIQ
jgi:gliding motility-associated-like protein